MYVFNSRIVYFAIYGCLHWAAVSATNFIQLFEAIMFLDAVAIWKYSVKHFKHLYSTRNTIMGNWTNISQVGYMLVKFCVREAENENEVSIKGHQCRAIRGCFCVHLQIWRDNLDWQPIGIHVVPLEDDYVSLFLYMFIVALSINSNQFS